MNDLKFQNRRRKKISVQFSFSGNAKSLPWGSWKLSLLGRTNFSTSNEANVDNGFDNCAARISNAAIQPSFFHLIQAKSWSLRRRSKFLRSLHRPDASEEEEDFVPRWHAAAVTAVGAELRLIFGFSSFTLEHSWVSLSLNSFTLPRSVTNR